MSRLAKNIIYNLSGQSALLILGFVSVKYIFKQLGEDALGIIYFTTLLNTLLCSALESGISATVVREVSMNYKTNQVYISDLIRTITSFFWGGYLIIGISIYFLSPLIVENWINLSSMDVSTATKILRLLGISSFVALPRSLYISLINGIQRMELNNAIDVITIGLQQFGTILILAFGGDLFFVVYWFTGIYLFRIAAHFFVCARLFSFSALLPGYFHYTLKKNALFAGNMAFITATGIIYTQLDKIIISKFMPISVLGYYSFLYGAISKTQLIANSITQAAYPNFTKLYHTDGHASLVSQYLKIQDILSFGIMPVFAFLLFAFPSLFSFAFNQEIANLLLWPSILLLLGFYILSILQIPYIFSLAVGKPEITARQHFYDLFVVPPVTFFLVYSFGLNGAALSMVFFFLWHCCVALPRICSECINIPVSQWLIHILKILLLAGITYGLAWGVIKLLNSLLSSSYLIIAYIIASFFYILGSYFLIAPDTRISIKHFFSNALSNTCKVG